MRPWLPYWWRDEDVEPEREWIIATSSAADAVIGELELWVAEHALGLIFVHAGVVAVDGRALLLPGRSFSGKSSLTAALLRCGASYGSDEYAVLTEDGRVRPYPRPLALRDGAQRRRVPAGDLGAETFTEALPVAGVADLRYQPDGEWDVERISRGTAVLRLFDNTVCAQSRSEAALDVLIAATDGARAVAGVRGEADRAVGPLIELLSGNN